jgi:hypothetical protein
MDGNDVEDILSQALEYRCNLRRELVFNSTWDHELEGEATGQSGGALAGGLDAQGRSAVGGLGVQGHGSNSGQGHGGNSAASTSQGAVTNLCAALPRSMLTLTRSPSTTLMIIFLMLRSMTAW